MPLVSRAYPSYAEYSRLQGRKASRKRGALLANLAADTARFEQVFRAAKARLAPGPVLCLGARTGAESIAAARAGYAGSVGIDLHPVGPTVMQADWHELPFANAAFPNAYTNSLDHCLYLDRLAAEVLRVLTPGGRFYVMASDKPGPGKNAKAWLANATNTHEALFWDCADELFQALTAYGFAPLTTWRTGVWSHCILTSQGAA